jgi:hypothetical protein
MQLIRHDHGLNKGMQLLSCIDESDISRLRLFNLCKHQMNQLCIKEEPRMMANNNQNRTKHTLFISVNVSQHANRTRVYHVSTFYVEYFHGIKINVFKLSCQFLRSMTIIYAGGSTTAVRNRAKIF